MKKRLLIASFAAHLVLSFGLFFWLYGSAAGMQDAGVPAPPGMGVLEIGLRFVLLQPLAHWVLMALPIAWWTWSGLAALVNHEMRHGREHRCHALRQPRSPGAPLRFEIRASARRSRCRCRWASAGDADGDLRPVADEVQCLAELGLNSAIVAIAIQAGCRRLRGRA